MKTTYHVSKSFFILLFMVICTIQVTAKVIENPSFGLRNTCVLSITKIEKTSKETKLYFHAQYIPHNWIRLQDSVFIEDITTGKRYYPIRFEGFEANKEVYMPESGKMDFSIIYPAIQKNIKVINWKENQDKDSWKIWDISMDSKKNKKEPFDYQVPKTVTDQPKDNGADFTKDNFFKTDSAYITGYLKGYDARIGFTTGIIYCSNELTRQDYPTVVKINPDGKFEAKLLLYYPIESHIFINNCSIPFYIEPGQHLDIQLNIDDLLYTQYGFDHKFPIIYTSPTADICQQVKEEYYTNMNDKSEYTKALNSLYKGLEKIHTPSQIIDKFIPLYEKEKVKVDSIIQADRYSPKAAHLKRNRETYRLGYRLLDFVDIRTDYASKDTTNACLKAPVEKNFYDFMKYIPIDDEVSLACMDYGIFINRFEYNKTLYNRELDINANFNRATPPYTMYDKFKNTFLWQLSTLRCIHVYKNELASGKISVRPNVFRNSTIISYANNLLSQTENEKKSYDLPDNEASRMFKKLIAPYKGKYIFVDFWGTTCGPCRAGIEAMAPLRKELRNNTQIQFLYITGTETSPSKKSYEEYVEKNLKGFPSLLLSSAEYLYLRELFHFNGIPRYVFIDRDGKIIDENYNSYQLNTFLKEKGIKSE
ncbi:MAG: TlpA family protein disulfide reductase [Bacteroidaceae bacterium]|nr:TlpA family protein disulfide reductase [Bacteroidaceae bacterium]